MAAETYKNENYLPSTTMWIEEILFLFFHSSHLLWWKLSSGNFQSFFFVLRWFCCYFCLLLCHSEPEKRWQMFFSVRILSALCCWVQFGKCEKWWGGNLLVSCAEFSVKFCGCMGPLWVYSKLLLSFLKISIEIWFNLI